MHSLCHNYETGCLVFFLNLHYGSVITRKAFPQLAWRTCDATRFFCRISRSDVSRRCSRRFCDIARQVASGVPSADLVGSIAAADCCWADVSCPSALCLRAASLIGCHRGRPAASSSRVVCVTARHAQDAATVVAPPRVSRSYTHWLRAPARPSCDTKLTSVGHKIFHCFRRRQKSVILNSRQNLFSRRTTITALQILPS